MVVILPFLHLDPLFPAIHVYCARIFPCIQPLAWKFSVQSLSEAFPCCLFSQQLFEFLFRECIVAGSALMFAGRLLSFSFWI